MGSDLFDKLRQMQKKRKTFDELPDMQKDGEDGIANFNLVKFKESALEGLKEQFRRQGKNPPEVKIVGVALHAILLNPDDSKREEMAHSEMVAWHKDCGDPERFLGEGKDDRCDSCGSTEEETLKKLKAMLGDSDGDDAPYNPGKYDGMMYG
jgi:hypothetical protein